MENVGLFVLAAINLIRSNLQVPMHLLWDVGPQSVQSPCSTILIDPCTDCMDELSEYPERQMVAVGFGKETVFVCFFSP